MRTDAEIREDVTEELRWTPYVDETDIAVKVTEGVVTLTGFVKSFDERCNAERAVKRISGVRALANDLETRLRHGDSQTDPELARAAATALDHELPYSAHLIRIVVENGHATLEGVVDWQYQKERADQAIRTLRGLTGVTNLVSVSGGDRPVASDIKLKIAGALKRSAEIDAGRINVQIDGQQVTLTGRVQSWSEHEAAADVAWSAPGVTEVRNHICVGP
ncbi:MAG: BON domain-containing protein [Gammaproteobacteria bacterium]